MIKVKEILDEEKYTSTIVFEEDLSLEEMMQLNTIIDHIKPAGSTIFWLGNKNLHFTYYPEDNFDE